MPEILIAKPATKPSEELVRIDPSVRLDVDLLEIRSQLRDKYAVADTRNGTNEQPITLIGLVPDEAIGPVTEHLRTLKIINEANNYLGDKSLEDLLKMRQASGSPSPTTASEG